VRVELPAGHVERGGGSPRRHGNNAAGEAELGGGGKVVVDVDEGGPCSSWKGKEA
jgi:hypothetical protein